MKVAHIALQETQTTGVKMKDENTVTIAKLTEVKQTLFEALNKATEALEQCQDGVTAHMTAKHYWLLELRTLIDNNHSCLVGSDHTIQDTINDLRGY